MGLGPNLISATIQLAQSGTNQPQNFGETGSQQVTLGTAPTAGAGFGGGNNKVDLAMHRAMVRIQNSGATAGSTAQIAIWGMSQSLQDQLSTLGQVIQFVPRNTITIAAGTDPNNMATRFVGTILQATPDYSGMPDVPFRFECNAGSAENTIPFPSSSFRGGTNAATILSTIAAAMGWGFENNGVNVTLSAPSLNGSAIEQVRTVAQHGGFNAALVPGGIGNQVLAIWPRYGQRKVTVPLLAPPPKGGLVRYPSYTQQGIKVECLFDPRIVFGGQVQVESSLKAATGTWNVYKVDDELDSLIPKGRWQCNVWAYNPAHPAPLPGA